jgi:hypothetical protein
MSLEHVRERLELLGLATAEVPTDRLNSATMTLTCFPMYMVANVDELNGEHGFRIPFFDLPGIETLRESYVIGTQEQYLDLDREHRRLLTSMLGHARPCDRVIYEHALETLRLLLEVAEPELAANVRTGIAKTIVAVAKASSGGFFGIGRKVSPNERVCIERIATLLDLHTVAEAEQALGELDEG